MRKPCFVVGCDNHANRAAILCMEHWHRLTVDEQRSLGNAQFRFAAMALRGAEVERDRAFEELEALATLMAQRSVARPSNRTSFVSHPQRSSTNGDFHG